MEMCQPSDAAVKNCLYILIRMAQHNTETAYAIFKCPRMMTVIFLFLTMDKINIPCKSKLYAFTLIRTISQAGKHMAANLVRYFNLKLFSL